MASREQVDLGVGSNHPESVQVALERLYRRSLVQVPYSDRLVFANGKNEVLVGVEETGGCVLEMAAAGIDFPSFCVYQTCQR